MSAKNIASAEAYYQAMNNKSIPDMEQYLHPNVRFTGPLADITGKEAVLEGAKRLLPLLGNLTIRAKFGSETQVMIVYDWDCAAPIGVLHVAALLTFDEDLISRIDLFYDARPFDKK